MKYAYHKFINSDKKWYPILAVYYLTYSCDFRCFYCSDGEKKPYYMLSKKDLSGKKSIEILRKIRKYSENIVLTGGEPLNHTDTDFILTNLRKLNFKEVVLTTNGYNIDKFVDKIAEAVTTLVISVDTMESEKADNIYKKGVGTFEIIRKNIEIASSVKKKNYKIVISSVVTPENIEDLYAVYNFAKEHGFIFAAQPQLVGVKPHELLVTSEKYRYFYDFIIGEKRKGEKIYGTTQYLEQMRDLRKFECNPFTMLVVAPDGGVFYPCLEIGHIAGNIMDFDSLHLIRSAGKKQFGLQPECDNRCQSACALGFSSLLKYPLSFLQDVLLDIKGAVKKTPGEKHVRVS